MYSVQLTKLGSYKIYEIIIRPNGNITQFLVKNKGYKKLENALQEVKRLLCQK